MDSESMRHQMNEVRTALSRNVAEHEILSDMLRAFQRWFDLNPGKGVAEIATQAPLILDHSSRNGQRQRKVGGQSLGTIGFDSGFQEVLRQARGEPISDLEAWERMKLLGVKSNSENPVGWVGRSAKKLVTMGRAEKIGPKSWKWIGPLNGHDAD